MNAPSRCRECSNLRDDGLCEALDTFDLVPDGCESFHARHVAGPLAPTDPRPLPCGAHVACPNCIPTEG